MGISLEGLIFLTFLYAGLILVGFLLGRWNYKPDNEDTTDDTKDLTQVITTVGDTKHITINKTYKNKGD